MFITMCVIAYNEEQTLPSVLEDISRQDYNHKDMELILVDSASTDSTKRIMENFALADSKTKIPFRRVCVIDNPKRTLPCGWNVALKEYTGNAILKVDAHASIPEDFVAKNVEILENNEFISGGQRPTIVDNSTPWRDSLLLAENSMFGSSIAPYRRNLGTRYVNSMFHAAYRREVFEKTGMFNENLARTEDNEIHYRMRKAGFKLCFNPDIISYQHTRSSLKRMLKQKYSNGYWIGLTLGVCPGCLSLYHFVPFAFVSAVILTTVLSVAAGMIGLGIFGGIIYMLTGIMWGSYWFLALLMSFLAVLTAERGQRNLTNIALPFLFFALHVSYGFGTLKGITKLVFSKKTFCKKLEE